MKNILIAVEYKGNVVAAYETLPLVASEVLREQHMNPARVVDFLLDMTDELELAMPGNSVSELIAYGANVEADEIHALTRHGWKRILCNVPAAA